MKSTKFVAILEEVPESVYVDADANQAWKSAKIAVQSAEQILLRRSFIPTLRWSSRFTTSTLMGHRYIRDALKIPLILDESVLSPEAMLQIIKLGAADRIVLKPNRVGGLVPALKNSRSM